MMELKITFSAPDLSAALTELAKAIGSRPSALLANASEAAVQEPEAYQGPRGSNEKMGRQQEPAALPEPVPVAPAPMPAVPTPAAAAPAPMPAVPTPAAAAPAPMSVVPTPAAVAPAPMPVVPTPAAVAPAPVPAVPAPAQAKTVSLQQIARAGAALVDQGKKAEVIGALRRYGVQAVTQLKPEQFGQFAGELRALGAQI